MGNIFDLKMAQRLKNLRIEHELSLAQLAKLCGVSRATLSRLENQEVSPTASVLGKLCATYGLTLSRLMSMVEADFAPVVTADQQEVWVDPETGFERRIISPPATALGAEMLECHLPPEQTITYDAPPKQGLEHHLYMLDGALKMSIDGAVYALKKGDCLRYQLFAASQFATGKNLSATYILTII